MMYKRIQIIIISTIFLISISAGSNAANIVTPPKTACFITIDNAHMSGNALKKEGKAAIKVKAKSKCNRTQSRVELTVEIHKTGLFYDHRVFTFTEISDGPIYASEEFYNYSTYKFCTSDRKTEYYGLAFATALIDGKTFRTPTVQSEKHNTFNCGT